MNTTFAVLNFFPDLIATTPPSFTEENQRATDFSNSFVQWILPLILIVVSIYAVKFLFQRQLTQFFQFLAVALLVLVLLINPQILSYIAAWFGEIVRPGSSPY